MLCCCCCCCRRCQRCRVRIVRHTHQRHTAQLMRCRLQRATCLTQIEERHQTSTAAAGDTLHSLHASDFCKILLECVLGHCLRCVHHVYMTCFAHLVGRSNLVDDLVRQFYVRLSICQVFNRQFFARITILVLAIQVDLSFVR